MLNGESTQGNFDKIHRLQRQYQKNCRLQNMSFVYGILSLNWFTSILRNQYSNWCMDFYKLYKLESCEEFDNQWLQVMTKYDVLSNIHVIGLYQITHFWVPCYFRGHLFGGMTTTGRSESINAFIKRFVSSYTNLIQLIKQVIIYY